VASFTQSGSLLASGLGNRVFTNFGLLKAGFTF
jgi:hypothetical protein